jgi:nitrogen-specific signal transduction histidine kinase
MVSKKIIQNHDGKFEIKSEPKNGTTVMISLPIKGKYIEQLEPKHQLDDDAIFGQSS